MMPTFLNLATCYSELNTEKIQLILPSVSEEDLNYIFSTYKLDNKLKPKKALR